MSGRAVATAGRGAVAARRTAPRITGRAMALFLIVVALLVAGVYPLRTYVEQRAEIASLRAEAQKLHQANAALEERIDELHTPAYLERLARECLGWVRAGEINFLIVPGRSGKGPC